LAAGYGRIVTGVLLQRRKSGKPLMMGNYTSVRRGSMDQGLRRVNFLWLGALVLAAFIGIACEHHYYRVYDPYYTDYHSWNDQEARYYHQWAAETHRDRDFRHLHPEEQKEYWTWRHNHGDHDDRDHR